jgi:heme-degrading monooxygenase HmoA
LEGNPTYGREEAEKELQERFKAVDEAIDELKSFLQASVLPKSESRG